MDEALLGADSEDPASRAAWLLHALVRQRPLRHGNHLVALAAILQFLALNGWEVDLDSPRGDQDRGCRARSRGARRRGSDRMADAPAAAE